MTQKRDYSDWSKTELIKEVEALKKQKTYGLVWEKDKTKEVFDYYINWDGIKNKEFFKDTEHKFPLLKSVNGKDISKSKNHNYHILIEGDNYHSLAVLNFTHQNLIDIIYIDPPYNTGNKDFRYNDSKKYTFDDATGKDWKFLSFD
jgi:adenine-specific DNA-methyltransferase